MNGFCRDVGTLLGVVLLATSLGIRPAAAQRVVNPHGPLPPGLDCAACHSNEAWRPLKAHPDFDHNRDTAFPLVGQHARTACQSCHLDLRFDQPQLAPDACASCHVDVHLGALSDDCASCHNTISFREVEGLEIHARTAFPLTGAHQQVACVSCHLDDRGGALAALETECVACHEQDYRTASSHVELGYPETCQDCHSTLAWSGTTFEHTTASGGFPLTGAHQRVACEACHSLPDFQPVFATRDANDCYTCHQADYEAEHAGSGFPTTCTSCHSTDSWEGTTFDHSLASNGFDLVGAHERIACESCHLLPGLDLLFHPTDQNDCYTCHQDDYDDEHAGSGFPTTCLTCHGTDTWEGADFEDHDQQFFPIYSGDHRGEWTDCQTCHTAPDDFSVFTCLVCHDHRQSKMDDEHDDVPGYVYESTQCYSCHPNGREEDDD